MRKLGKKEMKANERMQEKRFHCPFTSSSYSPRFSPFPIEQQPDIIFEQILFFFFFFLFFSFSLFLLALNRERSEKGQSGYGGICLFSVVIDWTKKNTRGVREESEIRQAISASSLFHPFMHPSLYRFNRSSTRVPTFFLAFLPRSSSSRDDQDDDEIIDQRGKNVDENMFRHFMIDPNMINEGRLFDWKKVSDEFPMCSDDNFIYSFTCLFPLPVSLSLSLSPFLCRLSYLIRSNEVKGLSFILH